MSDELVIAADFGTTAVKVVAVQQGMGVVHSVCESYPLHLDAGGVAEQLPDDWWRALVRAIKALRHHIDKFDARVRCLSLTSQILGVICVDEAGRALRPCMTWLDKRSAEVSRRIAGGYPEVLGYNAFKLLRWVQLCNGAPSHNGMDATSKMRWLVENEPQLLSRTRWFLDVKDWIVMKATGQALTSPESANLSWLMDARAGREGWSAELCRRTGIPQELLPPIRAGDEVIGELTQGAAAELGLHQSVVVMGGVADFTAAALGCGQVADGALHISAASSFWISGFFPGRRLSAAHSYATITSGIQFRPILIVSQENAGSALDWASQIFDQHQPEAPATAAKCFADIGRAREDDPFFMPWLAGEKVPVDNESMAGVFHGFRLHHDRSAVKRAVMEGLILNLRWAYEIASREKSVLASGPIRVVGGVAENSYFQQGLADALQRPIAVGATRFAGALGAATLAAPHMGWHPDVWSAAREIASQETTVIEPDADSSRLMALRAKRLHDIRKHVLKSFQTQS